MWLTLAVLLMTMWSLAACGAPQEEVTASTVSQPPRVRFGTLDRSTLGSSAIDLNGDGEADQVSWTSGSGALFMVERDLDFDGASDMYEYYEGNTVVEQEFQLDFDRAIDMVSYYVNGQLVRKEMSTTFDGQFTLSKFYDGSGQLTRVERDANADGRVDAWEFYTAGVLSQVGYDDNGDGQPDAMNSVE
jgi:hypothetical protein